MCPVPNEDLLAEAAGWICEQLQEEGTMMDPGLAGTIMDCEWAALLAGADPRNRPALVAEVLRRLREEDVRIGPLAPPPSSGPPVEGQPVPESLVVAVLSWEDDFLGLAGIRRESARLTQ